MQNRIDQLFQRKQENILSVFLTAGYPKALDTLEIIKHLNTTDVDLIEIGIPYSDPIADGPVIQKSSQIALNNGVNLNFIFEQLKDLRTHTQLPILLMGYLNTVLQFGLEDFYKKCADVGIDGLILPDLPIDEYNKHHKNLAKKYNIHVSFLISPNTSPERIKLIDRTSKGFIYLVSSNSTTGANKGISNNLKNTFEGIKKLPLKNPILIGFGIKGPKEFQQACELANGAIIGTSFVQLIGKSIDFKKDILNFINTIRHCERSEAI